MISQTPEGNGHLPGMEPHSADFTPANELERRARLWLQSMPGKVRARWSPEAMNRRRRVEQLLAEGWERPTGTSAGVSATMLRAALPDDCKCRGPYDNTYLMAFDDPNKAWWFRTPVEGVPLTELVLTARRLKVGRRHKSDSMALKYLLNNYTHDEIRAQVAFYALQKAAAQ